MHRVVDRCVDDAREGDVELAVLMGRRICSFECPTTDESEPVARERPVVDQPVGDKNR